MADLYEVLYCFGCKKHALVVKRRARKTTIAKCKSCGAKNAIGSIRDLSAIQGIGITIQNRLNRAGITTYAQLAEAKPEQVGEALGKLSRGARVEAWISHARDLVASK